MKYSRVQSEDVMAKKNQPPRGVTPDAPLAALMDAARAAEFLGVCEKTVRREYYRGNLAGVRVGSLLRFAPDALREYIAKGGSAA
jgi:excisionase family DNA binding protein